MVAARKRSDLLISPHADGRVVVKDPNDGEMYSLGEQEAFLLDCLDGHHSHDDVCRAFESRFGERLSSDEVSDFACMATRQGLAQPLTELPDSEPAGDTRSCPPDDSLVGSVGMTANSAGSESRQPATPVASTTASSSAFGVSNLLYWRRPLFDPDRLLNHLTPCLGFVWTVPFVVGSLILAGVAASILLLHGTQIFAATYELFRWHGVVPVWAALVTVIAFHELAHALTCKRFGGEVRECGFLLMFMMPCVYVDVSDAWLFPKRSQRVWVSLAGGFCELILWAAAVVAWRMTVPGSAVNSIALLVLSVTGFRSLFNFNPLIKLDGYYVLSDSVGIPNLAAKSREYLFAHLRWLLWGAPKPPQQTRSKFLLGYAATSWLFTTLLIGFVIYSLAAWLSGRVGFSGAVAVVGGGSVVLRGLFRGALGDDFGKMLARRTVRVVVWSVVAVCSAVFVTTFPVPDRVSGNLSLISSRGFEIRAPTSGFLDVAHTSEGSVLTSGDSICFLRVPGLEHHIASKRAELAEQQAKLEKLETGTRAEELAEQQSAVARGEAELVRAREDLNQATRALNARLQGLAARLADVQLRHRSGERNLVRATDLLDSNALTQRQYEDELQNVDSLQSQIDQIRAELAEAKLVGTVTEAAIVRDRQRARDEAQSELRLLQLPAHPTDIAAACASIDRLNAQLAELVARRHSLVVQSPGDGVVTTPGFGRTRGIWFNTGELICAVESTETLLSEIEISEVHLRSLKVGQNVWLKLNGLADTEIQTTIASIGPVVDANSFRSHQVVRCQVANHNVKLQPGMTGTASIQTGSRPLMAIMLDRCRKLLRSEFRW